MFAEFGQAPLSLELDLDTYDGLWVDVAGFRGRAGWLRVVRGTIQSEHEILESDIVVACDEAGYPIPEWRAIHLTQCHWKGLRECEVAPPDVLDDLLCEAEGAFYARWQRETNAEVAAEHQRTAALLDAWEMQRHHAVAGFSMELQSLRRERLRSIEPEQREVIAREIAELEYREEQWLQSYTSRRRELVEQGHRREEMLWSRTDVLIEFEPRFTVQWRAEAPVLHSRRNLYEQRAARHYRRPRMPRGQRKSLSEAPRFIGPAKVRLPRAEPLAPVSLSPEAAQLLANLEPLLEWKEARRCSLPRWVDADVLEGCLTALVAEDLRLAAREVQPGLGGAARRQVARMQTVVEAALRHLRAQAAVVVEAEGATADRPVEHCADEIADTVSADSTPPERAAETPELAARRAELEARLDRVERTLRALKPFAPRRPHYVQQASELRSQLERLGTSDEPSKVVDPEAAVDVPAPASPPDASPSPAAVMAPKPTYLHWTPERVALLISMAGDGKLADEIDQALGGVGKGRIMGKAHRLGLVIGGQPNTPAVSAEPAPAEPLAADSAAPAPHPEKSRREVLAESRARVSQRITDLEALEASHRSWTTPWFEARSLLAAARVQLEEVDRRMAELTDPVAVEAPSPPAPAHRAVTPSPPPETAPAAGMATWTPERLDLLRQMWGAGQSAEDIAEALGGISRNAVIGRAHRMGLGVAPRPAAEAPRPENWTEEEVATLTRLWSEGQAASAIGQALGRFSRNAVIAKAHRLGLPIREKL